MYIYKRIAPTVGNSYLIECSIIRSHSHDLCGVFADQIGVIQGYDWKHHPLACRSSDGDCTLSSAPRSAVVVLVCSLGLQEDRWELLSRGFLLASLTQ